MSSSSSATVESEFISPQVYRQMVTAGRGRPHGRDGSNDRLMGTLGQPSDRFEVGGFEFARVQPELQRMRITTPRRWGAAVEHGRRVLNEQRESTDGSSTASGSTCEVNERLIDQVAV